MAQTITFEDYDEAKLYAYKMRGQGMKARIRPRSSKWQVVLREKGEKGMPNGVPESGGTLSDTVGGEMTGGAVMPSGGGIMGERGESYQERMYRMPAGLREPNTPLRASRLPETPATVVSYREDDTELPPDQRTYARRGRTSDISFLRGAEPDVTFLGKQSYLKDSPDE